jgi:hypothetical protein
LQGISPAQRSRLTGFAIGASAPLALAFNDGGYDLVTRNRFGLIVWLAIVLGLAFGVLPRGRRTTGAWVAAGALGLLAILTAVSLTWTSSSERTFDELARVLQYGGVIALAFLGLNRHTWRGAAAGLATAALVVPLFSLTARLAPDLITDKAVEEFATDRLSYPFGYWNAVAAWCAMAIAIGIAWSAHARHTAVRALTLAAVPAAALACYLTYSRGGVIAAAIAVVAAIGFSHNRWTATAHTLVAAFGAAAAILTVRGQDEIARAAGDEGALIVVGVLALAGLVCAAAALAMRDAGLDRWWLRRQDTALLGTPVLAAILAVVLIGFNDQISDGWREFRDERTIAAPAGGDSASRLTSLGGNRYEIWQTAVDAFETEPAKGIGPGTFEFYWSENGDDPQYLRDAHSLYLEQLGELGIPGAALVLAFLLALLAAALAARRELREPNELGASAAATAAFVVFLFSAGVDWMWEMAAIGTLALGGIAVAAAGAFPRDREFGVWARAAAVAIAIAAAAVQVPGLVATERVHSSADALRDGEIQLAIDRADDAIAAQPWSASAYVGRALAEQAGGDLTAARADLGRAVDREPLNWRLHFLLARLEADAGNRGAVVEQLGEVRRLAPNSIFLVPGNEARGKIDQVLGPARAPGSQSARP